MPFADANGMRLFYRETGQGPPVLLIQGFEMDHRGWARILPHLRDRFRCITFDNRDVGQSSRATGPYTPREMARDAVGLLDALGVERAHIVGHSLGGAVAQEVALGWPERVDRLALLSTYVRQGPRHRAMAQARRVMRARLSLREYYEALFPWVYSDADYEVPGQVEEILERASANPSPQEYDAYCRQLEAVMAHNTEGRLGAIRAPTLVLTGERDLLTPLEESERLAREIPHARLVVVPRAGHGLLWTRDAEAVGRHLRAFLEGQE